MITQPPLSGVIGPAGGGGGVPAVVGQAVIYSGTGASQSNGDADFSPDLGIFRRRNANGGSLSGTVWNWVDNVRGVDKVLTNSTGNAELTDTLGVTSFDANGFSLGSSSRMNLSAGDFVVFLLQQAAGAFVIETHTGTGVAHTEPHSLGAVPELMIAKNRTNALRDWAVYAQAIGAANRLILNNTTGAASAASTWNSTAPNSTVYSVGTNAITNENGSEFAVYLFASLNPGIAIGTYSGDGNTNSPFVTTNFKPKILIVKRTDAAGNWFIFDDARDATSPHNTYQSLNLSGTDADVTTTNSAGGVDFTSTGFQFIDAAAADVNVSGATYLYVVIA